ncbi:MAG: peptidylprolyl isomerase [Coriobacteriia bacterium]|nr:peptidylprolyl isomerase [Coriobacteriia bacterium]
MNRLRLLAALAALVFATVMLAGCASSQPAAEQPAAPAETPAAPAAPATPAEQPAGLHTGAYAVKGGEIVRVTTNKGVFEIAFNADKAPNTVSSFLELVAAKFYDKIRVHRVEPGFVMQVGDPETRKLTAKQVPEIMARQKTGPLPSDPPLGSGGPGWNMAAEFSDLKHDRGVVAMARTQDPNSAGSQFYITLGPANHLDGQYTIFGHVVKGMEVVDKLTVGDVITSAVIVGGK